MNHQELADASWIKSVRLYGKKIGETCKIKDFLSY